MKKSKCTRCGKYQVTKGAKESMIEIFQNKYNFNTKVCFCYACQIDYISKLFIQKSYNEEEI